MEPNCISRASLQMHTLTATITVTTFKMKATSGRYRHRQGLSTVLAGTAHLSKGFLGLSLRRGGWPRCQWVGGGFEGWLVPSVLR